MNFQEFRKVLQTQKVFSTRDIAKEWPDFNHVNLVNWQEKDYILKLRNTWYAFPDALQTEADLYFLANRLRNPSYVSLETALRHYNWIPESVFSIISVTTTRPIEWSTPVGNFFYHSIKSRLFFGYQVKKELGVSFKMADPEKTLLDLLYFHPHLVEAKDFEGLRLNREEISERLDLSRLANYLMLINSPTLEVRWKSLRNYLAL